jgi:hypothetical protein
MNILFRGYFRQKNFQKNLAENSFRFGSGYKTRSGSGRFQKSDPDPVKIVGIHNTAKMDGKLTGTVGKMHLYNIRYIE